ncbi:hypothetical protein VQH23_21025 [Pararoseomonas sp. SCSIO 73927]|uniref:hypothetical protein n=1 Tax=Pararoseomonas sp. SCSIO 73927 TaxID=3114537 RepID=UPI0030CF4319
MMPHSVLSRRGAFGLAALLAFVRPAAAAGAQARLVAGELVELRSFGEGTCLDACGLEPIRTGLSVTRHPEGDPAELVTARERLGGRPAPWGWDTLENVR